MIRESMKIIWIGGNHPRHLYYLNSINNAFPISGMILERREGGTNSSVVEAPTELNEHDKKNFIKHFTNRKNAEERFFINQKLPEIKRLDISEMELNTEKTIKFIESISPDLVLTFGCHLIKDPLFSKLPKHTINMHGGLSPRYRGTATMFWPFYFLEPNHVGVTFHYIISEPDAGSIIHQSVPKLEYGDTIHDVACKAVISGSNDIVELLKIFERDRKWKTFVQRGTGKNFLERDFRAEHLKVIYDLYDDKIVDRFLDGTITPSNPNLIRQF